MEEEKEALQEERRELEEEQAKLRVLQGTISDLESYAENCNRRVERLESLFFQQNQEYAQLRQEVATHQTRLNQIQQDHAEEEEGEPPKEELMEEIPVVEEVDQAEALAKAEGELEEEKAVAERVGAEAVLLAAKNTLAKVQLKRHQEDLSKLSDLLASTKEILEIYREHSQVTDIETLLQKKIFHTLRLTNIQNALQAAGFLEQTQCGLERARGRDWTDPELEPLAAQLRQKEDADVAWLYVYRTISGHLAKLDEIRHSHLEEQKASLAKGKAGGGSVPPVEPVGMQPPESAAGFQHLQLLNGALNPGQEAAAEEEPIPISEVAGGLSAEEVKLGVDFDHEDEDNPYLQITDFFTSLTTVKYVLDCSNLCEDSLLPGTMKEEDLPSDEQVQQVEDLFLGRSNELLRNPAALLKKKDN